jgi:hypothetical protein
LQKLHLFVGQQCRNFCTVFGIMSLDYFRQSTIFGRDSLASATLSAPYAGDKFSVKRVQPFCDSLLLIFGKLWRRLPFLWLGSSMSQ